MSSYTENLLAAYPKTRSKLPKWLLHRFKQDLQEMDVIFDPNDPKYVLPPPSNKLAKDNASVVGASFVFPIHELCYEAHRYFQSKGANGGKSCFLTACEQELPDGLGIIQDMPYRFNPSEDYTGAFPAAFRAISNKVPKKENKDPNQYVHGLHYSVYPTERMLFVRFKQLIREVEDTLCKVLCKFEEGGEAASTTIWEPPVSTTIWEPPVKAAMPSSPEVRYICDALYQYFCTADNLNSANLAYLLFHHFGAENISFNDLMKLGDCSATRTVTLAMCQYIMPESHPFASTVCANVYDRLPEIVPDYIFGPDSEDDDGATVGDEEVEAGADVEDEDDCHPVADKEAKLGRHFKP